MRTLSTLLILAVFALPAAAQERPPSEPTPEIDVKKLKDRVAPDPRQLPPVRSDRPPTVPPTQLPPDRPRKSGQYTKAENAEIDRNMRRAMDNYNSIISGTDEADLATLEKRIASNTRLQTTQGQRLTKSQQQLRELRIVYTRRYLMLKGTYKQGQIDKPTYISRLKQLANEFDFSSRSLVSDVAFYRKELAGTKSRVSRLAQIQRLNRVASGRRAQPAEPRRTETSLEQMLSRVRSAGRFRIKNCATAD